MKVGILFVAVFCVLGLQAQSHDENNRPIVEIKQGKVQGIRGTNNNGRNYFAFKGIPYGKPPVGDLRFNRPEKAESWEGIRNGSTEGNNCLQYDHLITKTILGEEDCLFLNVYTPELPNPDQAKTVMVWIHGGGYGMGSGDQVFYGPGKLIQHDVIVVTLNYRLGILGFLSTGDEVCPGNYGLWDQNLALKWVQENIRSFGGDPAKVTIFGESAGSASVSAHIISQQSAGLFRAAILQSGTLLNPWAIHEDPRSEAESIAKDLGCPTYSSHNLLECLRNKIPIDVVTAVSKVQGSVFPVHFAPVVESEGQERFIADKPWELLKQERYNKVPTIVGLMENEAALFYYDMEESDKYNHFNQDFLNNNLDVLMKDITDFKHNFRAITASVHNDYLRDIDLSDISKVREPLIRIISDIFMDAGIFNFGRKLTQKDPDNTYMYLMSYKGQHSCSELLGKTQENYGATHCDDLLYVFDVDPLNGGKLEGHDQEVSKKLTTLFTDFAKTGGNPTPTTNDVISVKWSPLTSEKEMNYLLIDRDLSNKSNYRIDRMRLWNVILPKIEEAWIRKLKEEL